MTTDTDITIDEGARRRLAVIADALIPEAHGMPAASTIGVAEGQLDVVLSSRPDIAPALRRGLDDPELDDPMGALEQVRAGDPEAYDAIILVVAAGYYMHPEVHELIGYPGQVPKDAQRLGEHEMFEEGLAEMLAEVQARGPIYRQP